jgi:hypothetical protein
VNFLCSFSYSQKVKASLREAFTFWLYLIGR